MADANDKQNLGRLSIAELEQLLERENSWDDDSTIEIMPNGEIRVVGTTGNPKPLTFRERLGGEYAKAA